MNVMNPSYFFTAITVMLLCILLTEFFIIKYNGAPVPVPTIPRSPSISGTGPKLTYAVIGDSTSIGQGTEYKQSYAVKTAKHLARKYEVTLINTGISGARTGSLLNSQIHTVIRYKPDVVLLGVGANDTTHFTSLRHLRTSLQQIIDMLEQANPEVRIIATRSPALDSVSRFPPISRFILRIRTAQVNRVFDSVIKENHLTAALIAENTRAAFLADPTLTAADNFHPNAMGYALWVPIINNALDHALATPK